MRIKRSYHRIIADYKKLAALAKYITKPTLLTGNEFWIFL
jgi:hypothetical protein